MKLFLGSADQWATFQEAFPRDAAGCQAYRAVGKFKDWVVVKPRTIGGALALEANGLFYMLPNLAVSVGRLPLEIRKLIVPLPPNTNTVADLLQSLLNIDDL